MHETIQSVTQIQATIRPLPDLDERLKSQLSVKPLSRDVGQTHPKVRSR